MNTTSSPSRTVIDTQLLTHAKGLLHYAIADNTFAESLAAMIKKVLGDTPHQPLYPDTSQSLVMPHDQQEAIEVTTWLLNEVKHQPRRTTHTAAMLRTWAEAYHAPKDQIFGIVGIAIIGPTLGLIKSKKKKKSQLQVIVSKNWQQTHTAMELVSLVQTVSQSVIASELRLAGGNAYRLHPDSAEWCLSDPQTRLFSATEEELALLEKATKVEHLSHFAYRENGRLVALALSPSVNEEFTSDHCLEVMK